jgi:transposase
MSFAIALSDEQWELVADLFDPPGRRGAPAVIPRRQMVDAMLFIGRTGCQWRYLPEPYGAWTAVWAQWRRWRANGVWAGAMTRLAAIVRVLHDREPIPSMVVVDAQTVRGGRYGPTFHDAEPTQLVRRRRIRGTGDQHDVIAAGNERGREAMHADPEALIRRAGGIGLTTSTRRVDARPPGDCSLSPSPLARELRPEPYTTVLLRTLRTRGRARSRAVADSWAYRRPTVAR